MQVAFNWGCMFVGIILGAVAAWWYYRGRVDGVLKIDDSDPKKDRYRFEINELDKLGKLKRITLKIKHHVDLSHK